jgi:peptidoglycan/xylan/chitin deacetylase (PgdA/CDA1 family)
MAHRKRYAIAATPIAALVLAALTSVDAQPSPAVIRPAVIASTVRTPTPTVTPFITPGVAPRPSRALTKTIYLTFDDGPNPIWTSEILSILEAYGAHASFFVIGEDAKAWPYLVMREVLDGNLVGDHSWSHPNLTRLSPSAVSAELARDKSLITKLTGKAPSLWRPPYGAFNLSVFDIGSALAMRMQLWSVSTGDWQLPGTNVIVSRVMSALRNGLIVLLHDGGGHTRAETVAAVAILIPKLEAAGYRVAALPAQGMRW